MQFSVLCARYLLGNISNYAVALHDKGFIYWLIRRYWYSENVLCAVVTKECFKNCLCKSKINFTTGSSRKQECISTKLIETSTCMLLNCNIMTNKPFRQIFATARYGCHCIAHTIHCWLYIRKPGRITFLAAWKLILKLFIICVEYEAYLTHVWKQIIKIY